MKKSRLPWAGLALTTSIVTGATAMSDPKLTFDWEWRAGRTLDQRVVAHVEQVAEESRGLFGLSMSPSLGGHLPNARRVTAFVVTTDVEGTLSEGQRFKFRVPELELKGATNGDRLGIGFIGSLAVCIDRVPGELDGTELLIWLETAPCD